VISVLAAAKLEKGKNVGSLSPPSGAPLRIGAVADEKDEGGVETDKLDEALKAAPQVIERMLQA
jgi:hypothetical protein